MAVNEIRALFHMVAMTANTRAEYERFMTALIALLYEFEMNPSA